MAASAIRGALALLLTMAFSSAAQAGAIEFEGRLVDEQGQPLAGLPIRVVFDGDADPRAAEAGLRLSTDADGRFRRRIERAPQRRFVTLDVAFIPHRATHVGIGVELELVGRRTLYWIELDHVKGGTLSRMTAHLAGQGGRFDEPLPFREPASYVLPDGMLLTDIGAKLQAFELSPPAAADGPWRAQAVIVKQTFKRAPDRID